MSTAGRTAVIRMFGRLQDEQRAEKPCGLCGKPIITARLVKEGKSESAAELGACQCGADNEAGSVV